MQRTITLLIAAVLILVTVGVVMLYSASMVKGIDFDNDPAYFLMRQIIWLVLAAAAALVCIHMDIRFFRVFALPAALLCSLLLVLVRIPGIGACINGSWRWIPLGPLTVQPSEFSKLAVILAAAWWLARRQRHMHKFVKGLLIPLIGLGVFSVLLLVEPDFGTTILMSMVVFSLLYAGGARLAHLGLCAGAGMTGFGLLLLHNPNRMRRIFAFLDPEKYAQGEAWQLINARNAFARGGWKGAGLGNSIQKYYYLPEAHTDFIFPIIGEEFGIVATLSILILFVVIFFCGLRIASRARDDFSRFTALGITLMLTLQAIINLAVVTGSMPTKGLALPFISYGGSSLLICSAMIGILINVAHNARTAKTKRRSALFKDHNRKT